MPKIVSHGAARLLARWVVALSLLISGTGVYAQEPLTDEAFHGAQAQWTLLLDRTQRELSALKLDDALVERLNDMVNTAKAQAMRIRPQVKALSDAAAELLDALGPKPGDGEPAEDAETVAKRKELEANQSRYEGWEKQIEVAIARGDQLLDRVTSRRLELYARQLLQRQSSPINPSTWTSAAAGAGDIAANVGTSVALWWDRVAVPGGPFWPAVGYSALMTTLALAIGIVVAVLIRQRFGRPHIARSNPVPFSREQRLIGAIVETIAWAVPPLAAGFAAWSSFVLADVPNQVFFALLAGLAQGMVAFAVSAVLVWVTLSPHAGQWRLADLGDHEARRLAHRLMAVAALIGVDYAMDRATDPLVNIEAFTTIWLLLIAVGMVLAVRAVLDPRLWPSLQAVAAPTGAASATSPNVGKAGPMFRGLAMGAIYLTPVLALIGYGALGQYIYDNVVETAVIVAAAMLLRSLLHDYLPVLFDSRSGPGARLARTFGLDAQGLRLIEFWLTLVIDLAVILLAAIALAMCWGADRNDVLHVLVRLVEGVRIGPVTLSITDLILAGLVFAAVLMATRFIQHVLETRIFPGTQLDVGVRHSLRSGLGYIGLVVAVGMAISTIGLNLSNLALVAGALTVGIGFGLQNIVNNFVSGLILLVERPIKVGDWIVVGDKQGTVKRINVRATEIETFQRASVLIPNGDFLAQAVVNWTHKDKYGRLDIPVAVSGVGDARTAGQMLLACARGQAGVAANPAPQLLLKDFSGDSFQFELRIYVEDVYEMEHVGSELRYSIDAALRARAAKQAAE